jgi:hypothetical protein
MSKEFELQIQGVVPSLAGQYGLELQQELLQADPKLKISPRSSGEGHMDFGATLVLVLGTPAVIAVAHGIKAYLARRDVRVVVKSGDKTVELTNMRSEDIEAALRAAGL